MYMLFLYPTNVFHPRQVAAMVVNNPRVLEPASQDAAAAGPGGSQAPLRGTAAGGSGGGWEARLSLLCQQLAVSEAVARALVRRYPMVLRRDGAELAAVCGRLRAAAGSSPAWSAQLAEFREEQLEAALRLSDRRAPHACIVVERPSGWLHCVLRCLLAEGGAAAKGVSVEVLLASSSCRNSKRG